MSKLAIRRSVMAARRKIDFETRKKAFESICDNLLKLFPEVASRKGKELTVGAYSPINHELDGLSLLHKLRDVNPSIRLALPCIISDPLADNPSQMEYREYKNYSSLSLPPGPYTFLEPKKSMPTVIPDILLVPCVGFSSSGLYRLGMGGGYYDRYFQIPHHSSDMTQASSLASVTNESNLLPARPTAKTYGGAGGLSQDSSQSCASANNKCISSGDSFLETQDNLLEDLHSFSSSSEFSESEGDSPPSTNYYRPKRLGDVITKICVAFENQKIDHNRWVQPWDTMMDYVITEKGVIC